MASFISILIATIAGSATAFRVPAEPRGGPDITAPTDVPTAPEIPRAEPTQFHEPNSFGAPGAEHVPHELLFARAADPTVMEVPGASYMGCFQDGSNEVLSMTQITEFSLTPELCRNLCQIQLSASSGLGYFGLETGFYCFCGTNVAQFAVQAPESECSEACNGQTTVLCGGDKRIGIYTITSTVQGGPAGATGAGGGGGGGSASEVTLTTTDASGSTITSTSTTTKAAASSGSGSSSSSSSSPSLSIGAIIGIAIGGVVIGALVVGVIAWRLLKRKSNSMPQMQYAPPPPPSGPYGAPGTPQQQYAPPAPGYAPAATKQEGHVAYQQAPPPQPAAGSVSPANQGAYAPPPGPPPQQQQAPQEMGDGVYEIGHYYNR